MAFPSKLRELREAAGLTQSELAQRAGLSKAGVTQLEQGRRKPAWETVLALAAALGVSCEAFNEPAESDEKKSRGRPRKTPEQERVGGKPLKPAAKGRRKKGKGA
jgi:transcriptional regulator with XRE-family HTH domain